MYKLKVFLAISMLLVSLAPLKAESLPHPSTPIETKASFSDYYKKLKYEASLAYTKFSAGDSWWNKIAPFNIYLGALPLENKGHLKSILDLGVTHVLSMVEDFEVEDGWFNTPVTQQTWKEHGIDVKHIQAVDFLPLNADQLEEGIEYLANALEQGKTVYVHCKAGRGRSASVVIGFLMQYQNLSFTEAFALVKEQRPQIHLNNQQRQAIESYFAHDAATVTEEENFSGGIYNLLQNANALSEDRLANLLDGILYYVIEGVKYDNASILPDYFSTWVPTVEIQSTLQRRNRYLREFNGDQESATKAAIKRNHGLKRRLKVLAAGSIPFIGAPSSHSMSLWVQLREITLIASIHGHDIHDPEVRMKILSCLVGGDMLKIPAQSVKYVAKAIAKKILPDIALGAHSVIVIPARLVFDYFTDNAAYVATHAKIMFAGENSIPVNSEAYQQ